jgi:hypothetical protein
MEATTTKACPKCNDRGVVHEELSFGWTFRQCDCRPPEYWAERSKRRSAELDKRIKEAKRRFEGLNDGQETKEEKSR